jgi:serine/threonine protein kinase
VSAEAERSDPALIGRTISGKYRIEEFLGGGAMGAVYKARFAALEKNVAIKVMHSSIAVDPKFVARFHREAKAASRLDHPNSMRVIDFGEEPDGLLYIAMEYMRGRDLHRVIHEDWPISDADVGDILMQALAAIAVAHEMGVIHRDLKPENLMMLRAKNDDEREAYVVKVCDFGIAKITEKDDEAKTEGDPGGPPGTPGGQQLLTQGLVVGTPEYMSPEQARGEKLDARSDIYAIGIILYQLLSGRTPFTADTPLAVVLKQVNEAPPAPSVYYAGVHKGLEAIAMKALAKDRNERFQSARQMRNAIREALEGRTMPVDIAAIESAPTLAGEITASQLTPLGTAAAPPSPKRSRVGVIVGLVAGAALLAGGWLGAARLIHDGRGGHGGAQGTSDTSKAGPVTSATPEPTATTNPPSTTATTTIAATTPETTPPGPTPINPRAPKHGATSSRGNGVTGVGVTGVNGKGALEPPPVTAAVPAPPVVVPPAPEVPAIVNAPVSTSPVPFEPPAPQPAAFNAQTCRAATSGPVRSNGATNAKDLQVDNAVGTVTSCARSLLHERPGGPINATVQVRFSDSGQFRGASCVCASCSPALAQCVSGAGRAMSLRFHGDVTGEPSFEVPMTITCE